MKLWAGLGIIVLMALLSMAALVGMLVFDGIWDTVLLLLAVIPIAVGIWRYKVLSRKPLSKK